MVSHDAVIVICEEFETNGFGFGEVMTGVIGIVVLLVQVNMVAFE